MMVTAYVLFALIASTHGHTLTTQEFSSKEGCSHAAQTLTEVFKTFSIDTASVWCVPKNGVDE